MNRRRGFTMVELLTVIAIIALLSAIAYPVFSRAKDTAYRNSDLSHLNAIRSALQLYRVDQGGYPPALLGYVTRYSSGPNMGDVMPAQEITGFLYPKRIDNVSYFKPAYERANNLTITNAVYPNQDARQVGSAPILDLDGDGAITASDDIAEARQAFGPGDGFVCLDGTVTCAADQIAEFYKISGYDVAEVLTSPGRVELRYAKFWSTFSLTMGGSALDDPRQLGYDDPPDSTVVTWDSFFRNWENGTPRQERRDLVLFLGGAARAFDSLRLHQESWRVMP